MPHDFDAICDDFFLNVCLQTALPLPDSRETILQFCEAVQKEFTDMTTFYQRESGEYVLEGDRDSGSYRWLELESRRLTSGYFNPPDSEAGIRQHRWVLERATYYLGVSYLDVDCLDVVLGFNLDYTGNRDAIVAEALLGGSPLAAFAEEGQLTPLGMEPSLILALDRDCYTQARIGIETRNSSYQVRTGNYEEEPISVYFTVRGYPRPGERFDTKAAFDTQGQQAWDLTQRIVVPRVVQPIAAAISSRR